MQPHYWEILVLKPTPAFLNFLSSQFPAVILPEYRLLQTDNTGYVFQKQSSDEELLDEIESKYASMFRYEIRRWLDNEQIVHDINASFLDFLCCFKFELHTHMVVMEESLLDGQQMLCVKPRGIMVKWIREKITDMHVGDGEVITAQDIGQWLETGTALVKNLASVYDLKPFLKLHYYSLYETEMRRMCGDAVEVWPEIDSYQMFCRYFVVEYHSQLVHLS